MMVTENNHTHIHIKKRNKKLDNLEHFLLTANTIYSNDLIHGLFETYPATYNSITLLLCISTLNTTFQRYSFLMEPESVLEWSQTVGKNGKKNHTTEQQWGRIIPKLQMTCCSV